jgi:hypothetical protein
MDNLPSFRRFAAFSAIASFVLALASNMLQALPLNFSSEVFTRPVVMLQVGTSGAGLLRWGMITDMLGYYLALLPVALFLGHWCRSKDPLWVRFFTVCGVGYVLVGAIGAAVLAAVSPALIASYAQASSQERISVETIFETIWNFVYGGLWNILEVLLAGAWLFGIGLCLRVERRVFGVVTLILGISALLDALGVILGIDAVAMLGLLIFVGLTPFWALWLGIDLLRRPARIDTP